MSVLYQDGRPYLTQALRGTTNDRGEYRLFGLKAGQYYLVVPAQSFGLYSITEIPANTGQDVTLPIFQNYYPGVVNPDQALPLKIASRGETRALDFQLVSTTPGVKVSGKIDTDVVLTAPPIDPQRLPFQIQRNLDNEAYMRGFQEGRDVVFTRFSVAMIPLNRNALLTRSGSALIFSDYVPADAKRTDFRAANVAPGAYELVLFNANARIQSDPMLITVGSADVEGLQVSLRRMSLSGKLSFAPGSPSFPLRDAAVRLTPLHRAYSLDSVRVGADGIFKFDEITSGHYEVQVSDIPEDAFVESINFGQKRTEGADINVDPSGSELQIVLNAGGAKVEGSLRGADNRPIAGAEVVLVPRQASRREFRIFYKSSTTDESGNVVLRGVRPGEYDVYSWRSVPDTAYMNPTFLRSYENQGQPVRVSLAQTVKIQLKLIED
jgi:hypothetical protein